jgi:hypothetical protein
VAVLVVVGVVSAAVAGVFSGPGSAKPGTGSGYGTSATTVRRQTLTSQATVNATLQYAGSLTVTGKGGGTLTWLPTTGQRRPRVDH